MVIKNPPKVGMGGSIAQNQYRSWGLESAEAPENDQWCESADFTSEFACFEYQGFSWYGAHGIHGIHGAHGAGMAQDCCAPIDSLAVVHQRLPGILSQSTSMCRHWNSVAFTALRHFEEVPA